MSMRPYSTIGWFAAQMLGALYLEQNNDLAVQAWVLDGEANDFQRLCRVANTATTELPG